eukprot:gene28241-37154_t
MIIFKYGVVSLLDAPCGAVSDPWTQIAITRIQSHMPCFRYHGVDVVSSVIERNVGVVSKIHEWATFACQDLSDPIAPALPTGFDMILSRDALQHLHYKAIAGAFSAYCKTGATYILVGSYNESTANVDMKTPGGYFTINLRLPPFSLPDPLDIFVESMVDTESNHGAGRKYQLVYSLATICQAAELKKFIAEHTV